MKTLGIIGGMGPEATIDLYGKIVALTPATKDQEHIHTVIDSYAQIPDRTAFIIKSDPAAKDPAPFLIEAAKRLEQAGVQALCMPCNTAHFFLPQIQKEIHIPFISIIQSAIDELGRLPNKPRKVFVMATTGTRASKVYERQLKTAGFEVMPLPEDVQADLMRCIYDGVKKGKTQDYIVLFQQVLDRLAALKPDALLAACTELPLLTKHTQSSIAIVDATLALAKACVAFATGKKTANS